MKRVVIPELLDTDSGTPAEIAGSLSDLRIINRWFGGIATTQAMVEDVARGVRAKSLSWLEVAAGSGFVPRTVAMRMKERGLELKITLLDRADSHLRNGAANGAQAVAGDALNLPFADNSFDVVACCLFAHHLEAQELVRFVNEGLRVSRRAVMVNDLVRNAAHLALVYAGFPLFRSRITYNDAPASVRRAYTVNEMRAILGRTQAARVEIRRHYLFRMGAIAWKK